MLGHSPFLFLPLSLLRFRLSPFLFHSLNDAYPPSTLGRRRDSIETLGCPTLNGACDYRLEASLATFIPNPT
ncbi:hypothetical protein TNCV_1616031 [Trichonephila clavipes]|nr:hypothetical protein TNCV_1616031 [Trichonephila clavipes]